MLQAGHQCLHIVRSEVLLVCLAGQVALLECSILLQGILHHEPQGLLLHLSQLRGDSLTPCTAEPLVQLIIGCHRNLISPTQTRWQTQRTMLSLKGLISLIGIIARYGGDSICTGSHTWLGRSLPLISLSTLRHFILLKWSEVLVDQPLHCN